MISLPTTTADAAPRSRSTDWPSDRPPVVTYVECRTCGFEPAEQLLLPRNRCPKCHSHVWQRSVRPVLIPEAAGRVARGRPPRGEGDDGFIALASRHGRGRL